ncbi:hypothetical protein CFC21_004472 [Triticum aestivum]|uniref:Uncharacterized protein n=1 Tax=Triticum aestivum TaxID=4565 RepID=A0A3B5Y7R2_WHEAT|nr:uncharacterized protein LOC123070436 isoform X2 [Triticum aestivum]KAF6986753.1 hypothetical protein CFC21_004472 [Triticum aestivum]
MPRSASSHLVNAVAAGRVLFSSRGHPAGRCFLLISDNGSAPSSCLRAGAPIHPWIYVGLLRMDGHVRASLAAQRLVNAAAAGRPAVPCLLPSRGRQCLMFPSGDLRRCTEHPHDKTAALHGGAFRPARIAPSSNPVGSMCTRMFSTPAGGSARPPQDKFWFEVVVHRTPCPENPRPCLYRKRFYNVDKDKAELIFRHFLSRVNQDSKVAASDSLKSRFTKLKFIVTDKLYLVLVGAALKSGKMQLLIVCALFYVLFLRAPSFMRRMARVAAPPAKGNESE